MDSTDEEPGVGHNLMAGVGDRNGEIKRLTADMERALLTIEQAREDLAEVKAEAKEAGFRPQDVQAMATIARLRAGDKLAAARKKMEALEQVSAATGADLFSWAG